MAEIKLAVDAMGGDDAPSVVLQGVEAALSENPDIIVQLVGPAEVVGPFAATHERVVAVPATETIGMGEHAAKAVRKKKDSSIVMGCRLVKEGEAGGFFSAGSTGACMAAATLIIGRIKGIKRPALMTVIPSPQAKTVLTDIGANADCKPEYLVQFAHMGRVYAQVVLGIGDPSVGLLNIGEEDTKGSEFAQRCNALMRKKVPHFVGNAEGRDIALGGFDVIVTDGFTGNVVLKTFEGCAKALLGGLKNALTSSKKAMVGAALAGGAMREMKATVSADSYGGAQLLGVKGVCVIGHGSSSADAIKNGILTTASAIEQGMPARLAAAIAGDEEALSGDGAAAGDSSTSAADAASARNDEWGSDDAAPQPRHPERSEGEAPQPRHPERSEGEAPQPRHPERSAEGAESKDLSSGGESAGGAAAGDGNA